MSVVISEKFKDIKVELLKYPTEQDWLWVKQCTLNTVGKKLKSSTNTVDSEWKSQFCIYRNGKCTEMFPCGV